MNGVGGAWDELEIGLGLGLGNTWVAGKIGIQVVLEPEGVVGDGEHLEFGLEGEELGELADIETAVLELDIAFSDTGAAAHVMDLYVVVGAPAALLDGLDAGIYRDGSILGNRCNCLEPLSMNGAPLGPVSGVGQPFGRGLTDVLENSFSEFVGRIVLSPGGSGKEGGNVGCAHLIRMDDHGFLLNFTDNLVERYLDSLEFS